MILLTILVILINSLTISIYYKKKIDETVIVSIVFLALIVYICGLINDLQLGIRIIEILTAIEIVYISMALINAKEKSKILKLFFTPGLLLFIFFIFISIIINKNRIFEKHDEYNHWAVVIKNMFVFNNFGTNKNAIVRFSEYPPFTNIVQYLFIGIKKVYREDIIIIAQNILYFSLLLPITKKVEWDKSLKKMLFIIPIILFLPLIFYKDYYYDITVDGLLGIMLAYLFYQIVKEEENVHFKYIKIFSGLIMLSLTKTSGIALAILCFIALLIQIIKNRNNKKEVSIFIFMTLVVVLLVSLWYIKTSNQNKNWDFNKYIKITQYINEDSVKIGKELIKNIFVGHLSNIRNIPIIFYIITIISMQIIILHFYKKKNIKEYKNYKYYSITLLIEILLCIIAIYISYISIFKREEALNLVSFARYLSTVLLANSMFITMYLIELEDRLFRNIFLTIIVVTIVLFIPYEDIYMEYKYNCEYKTILDKKNATRHSAMLISRYSDVLNSTDKVLYLTSEPKRLLLRIKIIKYEMIPITIDKVTLEDINTIEEFANIAANYNYVYVNKLTKADSDFVKEIFKNNDIKTETLYRVNDDKTYIEVKD